MGSYASALNDASKPVYDNSAIASALGKYSSLYDGGVKNLRSIAAKSGRLNSGFFDSSLADLTNQKLSGQAGFLTSLPALERQAKMQNLQSLLGLGASWSGSAPVDTHQSGTTTSNLTSNSSTSMYGPGLMQNFASLLGGGLLNGNFDNLFSKRSGPQVI